MAGGVEKKTQQVMSGASKIQHSDVYLSCAGSLTPEPILLEIILNGTASSFTRLFVCFGLEDGTFSGCGR